MNPGCRGLQAGPQGRLNGHADQDCSPIPRLNQRLGINQGHLFKLIVIDAHVLRSPDFRMYSGTTSQGSSGPISAHRKACHAMSRAVRNLVEKLAMPCVGRVRNFGGKGLQRDLPG